MSRNQEALIDIIEAIKLITYYTEGVTSDALAESIEKQAP